MAPTACLLTIERCACVAVTAELARALQGFMIYGKIEDFYYKVIDILVQKDRRMDFVNNE